MIRSVEVDEKYIEFITDVRNKCETLYSSLMESDSNSYSVAIGRLIETPGVVGATISEYVVEVAVTYSDSELTITYMDYSKAIKKIPRGVELSIINSLSPNAGFLVDGELVEGTHFEVIYPDDRNMGGN